MTNYESDYSENSQYYRVPNEIIFGDFQSLAKNFSVQDPGDTLAHEFVAHNQGGNPDTQLVEKVHLEHMRLLAAYEDIRNQGATIPLETYWRVTDRFRDRIGMLLSGETDLP